MARNFKHKRPPKPERDRVVFTLLRAMQGWKSAEVARAANLSPGTISKLRTRRTRYPQHYTVISVMKALGYRYLWVPTEAGDQKRQPRVEVVEDRVVH